MPTSRKEGYYWVKVTEKISDHGGPSDEEWIIEYWDGEKWDAWYSESDSEFAEIDENVIERADDE